MERLCVDLICAYVIRIKLKKEYLNLKFVTMIDPDTGWFKITQYDDKIAVSIVDLVETLWITRYTIPMKIMYVQGSEFIVHKFIKYLIEEE